MDSPEQRRKRKRLIRPFYYYYYSHPHFLSVRSLLFCFSFITFLYFLSYHFSLTSSSSSSSFRPVLVISSTLPLLSSSSTDSIHHYSNNSNNLLSQFKIDHQVLFPNHVLLLLSKRNGNGFWIEKTDELECVYTKTLTHKNDNNWPSSDLDEIVSEKRDALWVDDYNDFRLIVGCPIPLQNYSTLVNLQRRGTDLVYRDNRTLLFWDNLAYEAALDGDTAVVFAKGLNLRPGRGSDPTQLSCHFGLGNWERDGRFFARTKAITAAQEVVRCLLPRSIRNPDKAKGCRVTIGVTHLIHAKAHHHVLLPSVARVLDPKFKVRRKKKNNGQKYELCVCTMVWNQAFSLREWILYHAWLGVQRWFIYDNNSDDGIKEVIEELEIEDYNVTRHLWPWIKTQEAGFSHCALRARDECNWVSFMDVDEFFYFPFPNRHRRRFKKMGFPGRNSLRALTANFSKSTSIGEIRTACHSFGPSGLKSPPSQGVTVGYTCRLQSPERHKSIVRPDALAPTLLNVVHHFHLKREFKYLNLPQGTAVINHYKYQVWESFRAKFFRRVATYVIDWKENQNEGSRDRAPGLGTEAIEPPNWRLQFCEVWDTGLRDFVLANFAHPSTGSLPWERSPL